MKIVSKFLSLSCLERCCRAKFLLVPVRDRQTMLRLAISVFRNDLRRSTQIFALGFFCCFAQVSAQAEIADGGICSSIPRHLLPLNISKIRYSRYDSRIPGRSNYYRNHELTYSRFKLPELKTEADYVLYSGRLEGPKGGHEKIDAMFTGWSYFCNTSWRADLPPETAKDDAPRIRLIQNALAMMNGEDGRGLNFETIHGPRKMRQDLTTVRVATVGGRLYLITTQPQTVIADISDNAPPGPSQSATVLPRFFRCGASIGSAINADTLKVKRLVSVTKFAPENKICGF